MAIVPWFDQVAPLRCGATESISPLRAASVPVLSKSVGRTLSVPAPAPPQSIEAMRVSPEKTSMAETKAELVTDLKAATIWFCSSAVTVNSRTTALYLAPAAAKTSKFSSTRPPLRSTFMIRLPVAV